MRFLFLRLAALTAALMLTGCAMNATIGAPATPPPPATLAPAPTPQVIYIQPAPAPAAQPAGVDVVLVVVIATGMLIGAIIAACITYALGRRDALQSTPATLQPYSNAMLYRLDVTQAEHEALMQWRARQQLQHADYMNQQIQVRR